jgi:hypothetical protein
MAKHTYQSAPAEGIMTLTPLDENQLKDALKAAIVEILEERRDLVRDVLEEALEDIALMHAIEEGERSSVVDRSEVFQILDSHV